MRISDWSSDVCSSDLLARDMRVRLIAEDLEILIFIGIDRGRMPFEVETGQRIGIARQLQPHLIHVVAVAVGVAARPDELADLPIALLRQHTDQPRIAGDVARATQNTFARTPKE